MLRIPPTIKRIRAEIMGPSPPRPQAPDLLILKRNRRLIRIRDLQQVGLLLRHRPAQSGQRVPEIIFQLLLQALGFNESRRGARIRVFGANSLEGVKTQSDIGTIDKLHDLPDERPGWCVGCPAPVLIRQPITVGSKHICQLSQIRSKDIEVSADIRRI